MEFHLNLASRTYLDRRSVHRWLLLVGGAAALLLAVNLVYGYFNWRQLQQVDAHLAEIDAKLLAQRGGAADFTPAKLEQVRKQIEAANEVLAADHFHWTVLLNRLEALLPEEVAIRSLQPNFRDRSLQISAMARSTEAMTALLDALLASEDMNQAYLGSHSLTELQSGEEVVQFSLVIKEAF